MIGYYDYLDRPKKHYCDECGREMDEGASSSGRYFYCRHGKDYASGTYYPTQDSQDEGKSKLSKEKLFLLDKRNQEIKQAWKKSQYAKVKGQFRI